MIVDDPEMIGGEPETSWLGHRFFNLRTLVSFAVAFALLAFLFSRLDIDFGQTLATMRRADPVLLLLALLAYYVAFPARGIRWQHMLRNTGIARPLPPWILGLIIFLSWFVNCIVPAKLGDVYRAYLLRKHSGLSLSMAGGTIVAERLIDFAFVLILIGASALVSFRGRMPEALVPFLEIGAALVLLAGLGILALRRWETQISRLVPRQFRGIYERFHGGTIGSFGAYGWLLLYTVIGWLAEIMRFWLVAQAVGLELGDGFFEQIAIATFVSLGSAIFTTATPTPGGLGGAEAAIVGALALLGTPGDVGVAVALLDRLISYWSLIIVGALIYFAWEVRQHAAPHSPTARTYEHAHRD